MLYKNFSLVGNREYLGRGAWLSLGLAVLLSLGILELIELFLQQSKNRTHGIFRTAAIFLSGEGLEWQIGQWIGCATLVEMLAFLFCIISAFFLSNKKL